MRNAPILRLGLIAVFSGVAIAFLGMWALRSHPPTPHHVLTPAQEEAYKEGFDLCYQRVIANAHPQGSNEWNEVLHRFEVCTAKLGVPIKTKWEPEENKWRWEIVYPEQAGQR